MIDVSNLDVEQLRKLRSRIDAILDGPADRLGDLDSAVAELKGAKERVAAAGKAAVTRAVRAFMEQFPEVEAVRWTQYTPYFNDGDACEFSVHGPNVKLAGDPYGGGDYDDGFMESWSLGYGAEEAGLPKPEPLMGAMKSLYAVMEEAEDAMKATFGDHVQVTIRRGADDAEVEEHSHD